jgi:catechol 2,3-dioxygenase-like lactoylglutathione lyase family enzyme
MVNIESGRISFTFTVKFPITRRIWIMKFNGINHLAMATGDMDTTIRFWRDLLGMRLIAGLGEPGYRHYFFEISENDMIAFFEWPGVEPVGEKEHGRPVKGHVVFDHVSFGVQAEDDLFELKDRLNAADIWVSEVIDHGFIHSIYTFDPNGIPVEFSCYVEGINIHRNPQMSDRSPSVVAKEGPEPQFERWPEVRERTGQEDRNVYPGAGSELFHGKEKGAD